ncbi:MAG: hypothetical protein ACRC9X_00620, partial [Bacteroidales bacterium]
PNCVWIYAEICLTEQIFTTETTKIHRILSIQINTNYIQFYLNINGNSTSNIQYSLNFYRFCTT